MALNTLALEMRELWKRVRLDAIRVAVREVIDQLEASDPTHAGDELRGSDGPRRAALRTCCDELRVGCGMVPLLTTTDGMLGSVSDSDWEADNAAALEAYRSRARLALREVLGCDADAPR